MSRLHPARIAVIALSAASIIIGAANAQELPQEITATTAIAPGEYRITAPIRIAASGITIDFGGATLHGADATADPDTFTGTAIIIEDQENVTIKNVVIRGFKVGIAATRCKKLQITDCDVSHNYAQRLRSGPETEDSSDWLWPHENDEGQWAKNYGGGIVLSECDAATIARCKGRHSQNGILLSRTTNTYVYDNDMSFNSGWGVALWRSSNNAITRNRLDYCVRGYSHGAYSRGQDSAAILVFEQCNKNYFAANSATHSGDGFFLYAGHETTRETGKGGCNGNIIYANDFSHAVANGIEATFSRENRFIENYMDECDYGIWAGYSHRSDFVQNRITRSLTAGIAIEHGAINWIEGNSFAENPRGVWLWWDNDDELLASAFGQHNETGSRDASINVNRFDRDQVAIDLDSSTEIMISSNEFKHCDVALSVKGASEEIFMGQNNVHGPDEIFIRNIAAAPVNYGGNYVEDLAVQGAVNEMLEAELQPLSIQWTQIQRPIGREPPIKGELYAFLPEGALRGRKTIVIGEWGPLDPAVPAVARATADGGAQARFHIMGDRLPWKATVLSGAVKLDSSDGKSPALLTVTPTQPGLIEYELEILLGNEKHEVHGICISAQWELSYFLWQPEGGTKEPILWNELKASEPKARATSSQLDFNWGGGRPADGISADHFATVARSNITLSAGTYEIGSISDDGIRVIVDGKTIIEDWTWHPPKENKTKIELAAGAHEFVVEHFEIDGHAQLSIWIRRE